MSLKAFGENLVQQAQQLKKDLELSPKDYYGEVLQRDGEREARMERGMVRDDFTGATYIESTNYER